MKASVGHATAVGLTRGWVLIRSMVRKSPSLRFSLSACVTTTFPSRVAMPELRGNAMTMRAELEELVKWISDLQKAKDSEPETTTLSREHWLLVEENLNSVSERVGKAQQELILRFPDSVLKEFALDVQREAKGLALRAHLLAYMAEPQDDHADEAGSADGDEAEGKGERDKKEQTELSPPPSPKATVERREAPSGIVGRVGNTIAKAHAKLVDLKNPDDDAKAFEGELGVLAEMALALREGSWELDSGESRVVPIEDGS